MPHCAQLISGWIQYRLRNRRQRTVGPNSKNPPEIKFNKFMKLTGCTNACNGLINFEYEAHAMTRNKNKVNFLKFAWENSWNHIKWTNFWQIVATCNHCAAGLAGSVQCLMRIWNMMSYGHGSKSCNIVLIGRYTSTECHEARRLAIHHTGW